MIPFAKEIVTGYRGIKIKPQTDRHNIFNNSINGINTLMYTVTQIISNRNLVMIQLLLSAIT